MIRPIFLSHGAPDLVFDRAPVRDFLVSLPLFMPRPRSVLVISAHWATRVPTVGLNRSSLTIHDFSGFPAGLYDLSYPAPGAPDIAADIVDLLSGAGSPVAMDIDRGLDHGAWVPMMLAWPDADIPVMQLSVQTHLGPGHHFEIGRALAGLPERDVLVMGSGGFTHNLSAWRRGVADGQLDVRQRKFAKWMDNAIVEARMCDLLSYRYQAPGAQEAHPTEEHLLPLFIALGAGGKDVQPRLMHHSYLNGLDLSAYMF